MPSIRCGVIGYSSTIFINESMGSQEVRVSEKYPREISNMKEIFIMDFGETKPTFVFKAESQCPINVM